MDCLHRLGTDFFGETDVGHRADCGFWVQRVAQFVAVHDGHSFFDEGVVEAIDHVDTLDPTAALAGVEHGRVDQGVNGGV